MGILNAAGYFDKLLDFFDAAVAEGFVREESRRIVVAAATPAALLDALEAYVAPPSLIETLRRQAAAPDADAAQFM